MENTFFLPTLPPRRIYHSIVKHTYHWTTELFLALAIIPSLSRGRNYGAGIIYLPVVLT